MSEDREDLPRREGDDDASMFSFAELREELADRGRSAEPNRPGSEGEESAPTDEESYFSDLLADVTGDSDSMWDDIDEEVDWERGGLLSDSKSQAIIELLRDAKNVLLVGPQLCPADYEIGTTLIGGADTGPFNLLLVTYSQSPDERLQVVRSYLEAVPAETRIIAVGGQTRSGASDTIETADGLVEVDVVSNPGDLKRIGIKISKAVHRWDDTGRRTVLCFHSLSLLRQYVNDDQRVFRFLAILRGLIGNNDGHAHYHIEGSDHEESLIATVRTLFDAVITYDEDGSVSLQT